LWQKSVDCFSDQVGSPQALPLPIFNQPLGLSTIVAHIAMIFTPNKVKTALCKPELTRRFVDQLW